jgi:hypothetical protein
MPTLRPIALGTFCNTLPVVVMALCCMPILAAMAALSRLSERRLPGTVGACPGEEVANGLRRHLTPLRAQLYR